MGDRKIYKGREFSQNLNNCNPKGLTDLSKNGNFVHMIGEKKYEVVHVGAGRYDLYLEGRIFFNFTLGSIPNNLLNNVILSIIKGIDLGIERGITVGQYNFSYKFNELVNYCHRTDLEM